LWAGWCFVFFSLAHSKLPTYILPAAPAIALLGGYYLECMLFDSTLLDLFRRARHLVPHWAMAALAATLLVASIVAWRLQMIGPVEAWIQVMVCAAGIMAVAIWGRQLSPTTAWLVCSLAAAIVVCETAFDMIPAWSQRRSILSVNDKIRDL